MQARIEEEIREKDRLKAEAEEVAKSKIFEMQEEFKKIMDKELKKKMAVLDMQYQQENKELKS